VTEVGLGYEEGITTAVCILLNASGNRTNEAEGLATGVRWFGNACGILPLLLLNTFGPG
jgi:hypothetical protein